MTDLEKAEYEVERIKHNLKVDKVKEILSYGKYIKYEREKYTHSYKDEGVFDIGIISDIEIDFDKSQFTLEISFPNLPTYDIDDWHNFYPKTSINLCFLMSEIDYLKKMIVAEEDFNKWVKDYLDCVNDRIQFEVDCFREKTPSNIVHKDKLTDEEEKKIDLQKIVNKSI